MKRVLVVDDDTPVRRIIKHHLLKEGFEVVEAEDGMKALEVVRSTSVDLILLDIRMPMMDGYELADRLQADPATADIPIVVSSVVADEAQATYEGGILVVELPLADPREGARQVQIKSVGDEQEAEES